MGALVATAPGLSKEILNLDPGAAPGLNLDPGSASAITNNKPVSFVTYTMLKQTAFCFSLQSTSNIAQSMVVSVPISDTKTDISLRAIQHMPKDSEGNVILWEIQPDMNNYRCCFPSCDYMGNGIIEIRQHASLDHGVAQVFCVWCKGRKTFLRSHNFQGHVRQLHPTMRNFVNGNMLEQFAVVPELWPRRRRYAFIEDPNLREVIRIWWNNENRRRRHLGLMELKLELC